MYIQIPALTRFKDYILTQVHSDSCPNTFQGLYSNTDVSDSCPNTSQGLYSNTGAFRLPAIRRFKDYILTQVHSDSWPNTFQGLYSNTGAFRLLP